MTDADNSKSFIDVSNTKVWKVIKFFLNSNKQEKLLKYISILIRVQTHLKAPFALMISEVSFYASWRLSKLLGL